MGQAIVWLGTAVEFVLLWRLIRWRAWRHYPIFFAFYLYLFVRNLLLIYVTHTNALTQQQYSLWYWNTSVFAALLWFPLGWEIFRCVFRKHSVLARIAGTLLIVTMFGLAAFYAFGSTSPGIHLLPDVQRKAAMTITLWIVVLLLLVRYYGITPSLNVWGIAVGQGLFTALSLINFSALGINEQWLPVISYVRQSSFVVTLFIWTWALWDYRPRPDAHPPATPDGSLALKAAPSWGRVKEAMRKALGL